MQLHVKCLSEFFEVIVVNSDCDYDQICDRYRPDLTLFESGFKSSFSRKIVVENTSSNYEIPKIGLHNGDPWCDCRPGFISDMEHWGIDTFFTISTTTAEHTPDISENLFVWPNFIDSDIHLDYGESKIVPILFTGSKISLYPWRQKIFRKIASHYPSLNFPHLGYESHSPLMIYGTQYARTINASWFVPACGTVAKEVVRKHFEVPGCKACLITEKSPALELAGFVDMQNCIFADEKDISDKLDFLFKNTNELERIIDAGYEFVQTRHTLKQRDQLFQWFNLNRYLKPGEKIVQLNPFEPLSIVEKRSFITNKPIVCSGLHLQLLHRGDKKLWAGEYDEAEALYLKCLNYISTMSEPKLKLAICNLNKGNVDNAFHWIIEPIQYNLGVYGARDSDPIEWAYYIITLLCQGKLNEAVIRINQFPFLTHLELYRTSCVVKYLQNGGKGSLVADYTLPKSRYSIHQLPNVRFVEWISKLCRMLKACQQVNYAEMLINGISLKEALIETSAKDRNFIRIFKNELLIFRVKTTEKLNYVFDVFDIPVGRKGLPSISLSDYIFRLLKWLKFNSVKTYLGKFQFLKNNSEIDKDEFLMIVKDILLSEDIKTVIIIGSSVCPTLEAIFMNQNINDKPAVFNVHVQTIKSSKSNHEGCSTYGILNDSKSLQVDLKDSINRVKRDNGISFFDMVLVDNSVFESKVELNQLKGANFIILENTHKLLNYQNKQTLALDPGYTIVSEDALDHNGYAIFKKVSNYPFTGTLCKSFPEKCSQTFHG